jgi:hypothetical protein
MHPHRLDCPSIALGFPVHVLVGACRFLAMAFGSTFADFMGHCALHFLDLFCIRFGDFADKFYKVSPYNLIEESTCYNLRRAPPGSIQRACGPSIRSLLTT